MIDRREFIALIGAGLAGGYFFPRKVESGHPQEGSLAGLGNDDHPQYYPIYMRTRDLDSSSDIWELWQPGIVLGVGYLGGKLRKPEKPFRVELHSPHRASRDVNEHGLVVSRLCYTLSSMGCTMRLMADLASAFRECMVHGMVVVDGDVIPYRAVGSRKWYVASKIPLLLRHYQAVSLVGAGELEPIPPKYTHKEYVELCYERERRTGLR